jgi:hypothetical protein
MVQESAAAQTQAMRAQTAKNILPEMSNSDSLPGAIWQRNEAVLINPEEIVQQNPNFKFFYAGLRIKETDIPIYRMCILKTVVFTIQDESGRSASEEARASRGSRCSVVQPHEHLGGRLRQGTTTMDNSGNRF